MRWDVAALACAAWVATLAGTSTADVLREARELRRQMQYAAAQERLGIALPDLQGEARAQALFLLAGLATDLKEARRLFHDAARASSSNDTQQRCDLELARLDYSVGNYRSVQTRLKDYDDEEAALLLAASDVALGEVRDLAEVLRPARRNDLAQLLLGWGDRSAGDLQHALVAFERLSKQRQSDVLPTALLWKAECEAALGLRDRALQSCGELMQRFPAAPEATLIEPTLHALRGGGASSDTVAAVAERPGRVSLQVGAFEDRANALRFKELVARQVHPVQVQEMLEGSRRIYRVQVGPFETRDAAEAFGREQLTPRGLRWSIVRPEEP